MSTAVLEPTSAIVADVASIHGHEQEQGLAGVVGGTSRKRVSPELLRASEQLSHLASLHHQSDYSHLKFGPKGAPCVYIPMSIHVPDHVENLKELQAARAAQQAWWLTTNQLSAEARQSEYPSKIEPIITRTSGSAQLKDDLHAALTTCLDTQPSISPPMPSDTQHSLRTSETHPINISTMIPPELLQLISSNLTRADPDLPVIFNVPSSCQLHRLLFRSHDPRIHSRSASVADVLPSSEQGHAVTLSPSPPRPLTASSKPSGFANLFWTQAFLRKAVITSAFGSSSGKSVSFRHTVSIPSSSTSGEAKLTLNSHTAPFSAKIPPDQLETTLPAVSLTSDKSLLDRRRDRRHSPTSLKSNASSQRGGLSVNLGNLLLSSCPGKKVRLSGPVKGRGAVCRDLCQDLKRMSDMGVRCIVCCLDDTELEFLGAPWHEYSRTADQLGLDVLRIQIPEGLVPLDVETFDAHLSRLIDTYTLAGRHVLVHCRGGVGRAGLVACCWTVKLGLCGWIESEAQAGNDSDPEVSSGPVLSDTLRVVEKVLTVVRRQRSPKAIETFEQVKFLTDYVEFLKEHASLSLHSTGRCLVIA